MFICFGLQSFFSKVFSPVTPLVHSFCKETLFQMHRKHFESIVLGTAGNTLSLMTFISVLSGPKDMQIIRAESIFKNRPSTVITIAFSCTSAVPKPLSLPVEPFQRKHIVSIKFSLCCSEFTNE